MVYMTIPEMNRKLEQVSQFFVSKSKQFTSKIQLHEGQFRQQDYRNFQIILEQIKNDAMQRIRKFFQQIFQVRSSTYQSQITTFVQNGDSVKTTLRDFRQNLIKTTLQTKQQQTRKEKVMEHFSQKLRKNFIMKKCFKIWKDYQAQRKLEKIQNQRMTLIYRKNLYKKCFFPWRTLTYKDGYASTVTKQTDKDIQHIQQQYQGIIDILKQKIRETDQIIKVKKAAKGQFAYALSKNLLKTISNLSLQVMNLNQMSLRDGQWSEQSTKKFMQEVDYVIHQKLTKVRQYRKGLTQGQITTQQIQRQKKKKHISFA